MQEHSMSSRPTSTTGQSKSRDQKEPGNTTRISSKGVRKLPPDKLKQMKERNAKIGAAMVKSLNETTRKGLL